MRSCERFLKCLADAFLDLVASPLGKLETLLAPMIDCATFAVFKFSDFVPPVSICSTSSSNAPSSSASLSRRLIFLAKSDRRRRGAAFGARSAVPKNSCDSISPGSLCLRKKARKLAPDPIHRHWCDACKKVHVSPLARNESFVVENEENTCWHNQHRNLIRVEHPCQCVSSSELTLASLSGNASFIWAHGMVPVHLSGREWTMRLSKQEEGVQSRGRERANSFGRTFNREPGQMQRERAFVQQKPVV